MHQISGFFSQCPCMGYLSFIIYTTTLQLGLFKTTEILPKFFRFDLLTTKSFVSKHPTYNAGRGDQAQGLGCWRAGPSPLLHRNAARDVTVAGTRLQHF